MTNDESMTNNEKLGSAGASLPLLGAPPKSFRWCTRVDTTAAAAALALCFLTFWRFNGLRI